MKDYRTKEKFIELRAQGLSYANISELLNVSKPTLIEWGKKLSSEIEELKARELDALREKFYMHREHRIQLFGEQLLKIRDELARRDLDNIPTPSLLRLFLRFCDALRSELEPPGSQSSNSVNIRGIIEHWDEIVGQCVLEGQDGE